MSKSKTRGLLGCGGGIWKVEPKRMYDLFFLVQILDMLANTLPCVNTPRPTLNKCLGHLGPPLPAREVGESVVQLFSRGYQLADDGEGNVHEPRRW